MTRFNGKVALVTGAASGIGRATALRLAEEGAKVACVDLQAEALEEVVGACQAASGDALSFALDVSDEASVNKCVADTVQRYGQLDVLCNVAGILRFEHSHQIKLQDWQRILDVNLTGTFLFCREAIPHLLKVKGAIVNTSSTAALGGHPWTLAYTASKGGILSLTHGLSVEYKNQGLRANAVCPGAVKTPMHNAFVLPEGADPGLLARITGQDKYRPPEAAASLICFLASKDAAHINGEHIRVDGGMLA
ncbi:MAG: SDR family NAD(P)-dependent oxidoreductase [Polyangiaceae bacterium]